MLWFCCFAVLLFCCFAVLLFCCFAVLLLAFGFAPPPACRGRLGGGAFDPPAKSNPTPTLPCAQGRAHICRTGSFQGLGFTLRLLQLCACSGPALDPASTNSARRTRAALRGPCAAVRWGRQAPLGESTWIVDSFSPARGCAVEKPDLTSRTFWAESPESVARGGILFWSLSLGHAREK
jgi:hypothetical protein